MAVVAKRLDAGKIQIHYTADKPVRLLPAPEKDGN